MSQLPITPYRQGNLDGLCAYYSVINAVSVIAARNRCLGGAAGRLRGSLARASIEELLMVLTASSPSLQRRAGWAVSSGVETSHMTNLIVVASHWLNRNYDLQLFARRPFYRTARMSQRELADVITNAGREASAVIIEGQYPWNHWSVALNVNKRGIVLFDSSGYHGVAWKKAPKGRAPHFGLLIPRSVIVFGAKVAQEPSAALHH